MIFQGWSIFIWLVLFVFVICGVAVVIGVMNHDGEQSILGLLTLAGVVVSLLDRQIKHVDVKQSEKKIENKIDQNTQVSLIAAEGNADSTEDLRKLQQVKKETNEAGQ